MHPNESIPEPWLSFFTGFGGVRGKLELACMGISSSPWCTDFRGRQETWTSHWKSHRGMLADSCSTWACRGVRYTRSTRSILTTLVWRMCRKTTRYRSPKSFPKPSSISGSWPWILTTLHCQSSNTTFSATRRCEAPGANCPTRSGSIDRAYQRELRWQLGDPKREDLTLRLWIEVIQEEKLQ